MVSETAPYKKRRIMVRSIFGRFSIITIYCVFAVICILHIVVYIKNPKQCKVFFGGSFALYIIFIFFYINYSPPDPDQ